MASNIIEPSIAPRFQNSKQQETSQPRCPKHDKNTCYYISSIIRISHKKRHECQDEEIGSTGKVCDFIELESPGDEETEKLPSESDEKGDKEIVTVENVNNHRVGVSLVCQ